MDHRGVDMDHTADNRSNNVNNTYVKSKCTARLFAVLICAGSVLPACAQSNTSLSPPQEESERYNQITADRGWETEPWTGDDRPFAAARAAIDRVFIAKKDLSPQLTQYEALAKAHPGNPLDQFQWAYAFRLEGSVPHPDGRDGMPLVIAMVNARQPHTYNYTRLRFIYQVVEPEGCNLAKRLLDKDPNDTRVREVYAAILSESKSKVDEDLAVKIVRAIVDKAEDTPASDGLMACVYANVGFLEKNPEYYKKSIEANNLFLKLTPSYDWRRAAALHSNEVLQRRLNENK